MNREIELKLALPHDAATAFLQWPLLPAEHKTAKLHATYFDTPQGDLARQGVSLRIRRSGRKRIQTVKADGNGAAGLFSRNEWEMPVRNDTPVLDDGNPVAAMLGDAVASIEPRFSVIVERRTRIVRQDDAEIELVLDNGTVSTADRQSPVCEIELELKSGEPAALFALAQRIAADWPVRPGVMTKAERGHRLRDAAPASFKAEPLTLDPTARADDAFARMAHACLRHYLLNEASLIAHYEPSALHQARVAIRRLRSAFWLFKSVLHPDDVARFQGELRWWASIMGEARDLDVLSGRIDDEEQLALIEPARTTAREQVATWIASARVRLLLLDLVEWLAIDAGHSDGAEKSAAKVVARRLQKLRRRIRKNGRHMTAISDEARHAVRKDGKKLRYGSELVSGLFDGKRQIKRQAKFVASLERMQARLGDLNDLATMPELLTRHGLDITVAPSGKDRDALLETAEQAHSAFADRRRFWS